MSFRADTQSLVLQDDVNNVPSKAVHQLTHCRNQKAINGYLFL